MVSFCCGCRVPPFFVVSKGTSGDTITFFGRHKTRTSCPNMVTLFCAWLFSFDLWEGAIPHPGQGEPTKSMEPPNRNPGGWSWSPDVFPVAGSMTSVPKRRSTFSSRATEPLVSSLCTLPPTNMATDTGHPEHLLGTLPQMLFVGREGKAQNGPPQEKHPTAAAGAPNTRAKGGICCPSQGLPGGRGGSKANGPEITQGVVRCLVS